MFSYPTPRPGELATKESVSGRASISLKRLLLFLSCHTSLRSWSPSGKDKNYGMDIKAIMVLKTLLPTSTYATKREDDSVKNLYF